MAADAPSMLMGKPKPIYWSRFAVATGNMPLLRRLVAIVHASNRELLRVEDFMVKVHVSAINLALCTNSYGELESHQNKISLER